MGISKIASISLN